MSKTHKVELPKEPPDMVVPTYLSLPSECHTWEYKNLQRSSAPALKLPQATSQRAGTSTAHIVDLRLNAIQNQ